MSIFRTRRPTGPVADKPSRLFLDLKREAGIKYLWSHQEKVLDDYHLNHLSNSNVAIELPTGSGKTLVGLLVAEWRRRAKGNRVAYLCPTRQLCNQVHAQAKKYGISSSLLVGPQKEYDPVAFSNYQRSEAIAITTYSAIFNVNPAINDPQIIICDDAHAGEGFFGSMWSLQLSYKDNRDAYNRFIDVIKDELPPDSLRKLTNPNRESEKSFVELIPLPKFHAKIDQMSDMLEVECKNAPLCFPWNMIRGHLDACNIYISQYEVLIRPLVPPTMTHQPFSGADQRIFMSATLGEGGEIERISGVPKIHRVPMPEGWEQINTGRRLVLFPDLLPKEHQATAMSYVLAKGRTLIIVKDGKAIDTVRQNFPGITILSAKDVEESLAPFTTSTSPTALVLANRYDGIDLPGDECRKMFILGLPASSDLQEKFFYNRMTAQSQFRDTIRTRITQGLGRCTRDENDYAIALLMGNDILKWCCTAINTAGMNPEIQAEILFGLENSKDRNSDDFISLCDAFMEQGEDWQGANQQIVDDRMRLIKVKDEVTIALEKSLVHEIKYVYRLWNHDYRDAYASAHAATEALAGGKELKPYRAYWHYAASSAAFLANNEKGDTAWAVNFQTHLTNALSLTLGLSFLIAIKDAMGNVGISQEITLDASIISMLLEEWQIVGTKYYKELDTVKQEIYSDVAESFHRGLLKLGRMLGCDSRIFKEDGAPDGVWIFANNKAVIFEAKTKENAKNAISLEAIRQARTHEDWLKNNTSLLAFVSTAETCLVTNQTKVKQDAATVAGGIRYLNAQVVRDLFEKAATVLTVIRTRAKDVPEEIVSEMIYDGYRKMKLSHEEILATLISVDICDLEIEN